MSDPRTRGPGGLPLFELGFPAAGLGFGRADFLEACGRLPMVSSFVDAHFEGPDAPDLCVVLDEPSRTVTRAAAVLAIAAELSARGRRVVVLDGDDHLPDLTRWAGLLEEEGWIDVVRYDLSLGAASTRLPMGDGTSLLLGVGSYQPTRATAEELNRLMEFLQDEVDHVLVCASTGDRGAVWAALPSLRVVCWDPVSQFANNVENMVRDAGLLGEPPRAVLAYAAADDTVIDPGGFDYDEDAVPAGSSPVFRRMAILMGVLVVVLAIWWVGQIDFSGSDDPIADEGDVVVVLDSTVTGRDSADAELAAPDSAAVPTDEPSEIVDSVIEAPAEEPAVDTTAEASTATHDPFADVVGADGWCLWVYSLADSSLAAGELARMEARGFRAAVRTAVVDDRTWYRIYTGSFATQSDATAALDDLFARLETDWALAQRSRVLR